MLHQVVAEVCGPRNFFVAPTLQVFLHHGKEEISWEVFQGRLLDPAHTRQTRFFESWSLYLGTPENRSAVALLSLKLDREANEIHVVRSIDSYVWEGYDAGGNVYLSREVRKWVRELAGTVRLDQFPTYAELRDELTCQLFHAVVGSSRLPLASVETPLPQFAFGELFYCYRPDDGATGRWLSNPYELVICMLTPQTSRPARGRLLETFLHATPFAEMAGAVDHFVERWRDLGHGPTDLGTLLRTMFNDVSLSPYTDLVDKTLAFLRALEDGGHFSAAMSFDFLGYLLRQNGRHLTAYDLVTFHHRGANYPDALLLDAVLKDYLARIERDPALCSGEGAAQRRRRRALRQSFLLRRRYENHPVPDAPTSPGENMRVLPPSHPRVPEEQLTQPSQRTKRLYADDSLTKYVGPQAAAVLRQSVADLEHPDELRELGMALFLDRPFGVGKAPAEPDATLLLSAEAFSRSIADERVLYLTQPLGLLTAKECEMHCQRLREMPVKGLPLDAVSSAPRPGVIALSDARRAAPDFVFLRTTSATLRELFEQYDFATFQERFHLGFLADPRDLLLARAPNGTSLVLYDQEMRPHVEVEVDTRKGYRRRAGREVPVAGLRVLRVWEDGKDGPTLVEPDCIELTANG